MDAQQVLREIIVAYQGQARNNKIIQRVTKAIQEGTATYADADRLALASGDILTELFRKRLPEVLTNGRLYRATADVVVKESMLHSCSTMDQMIRQIQAALNENAGININPIVPEVNEEQIDGIITGICNAPSYKEGEETFMDQVVNCLEGHTDDWVRENADFQYHAGLSPTIERRPMGKCCAWCDALAGVYEYSEVSNRGNDVFRRHNNCHCQVLYNPGDGSRRRQNVHTRRWTG